MRLFKSHLLPGLVWVGVCFAIGSFTARADVAHTFPRPIRTPKLLYQTVTPFTNVGTGEETAYTYTLPAGTLSNAGDSLKIETWGINGSTATATVLRVKFGSSTIIARSGNAAASAIISGYGTVTRITATTQTTHGFGISATADDQALAGLMGQDAGAETLTADVAILVTVQAGTNANFTTKAFLVWLYPAP